MLVAHVGGETRRTAHWGEEASDPGYARSAPQRTTILARRPPSVR